MTPELWQRASEIFAEAIELTPDEVAAYLERACVGNPELLAEVRRLLADHARACDFLEGGLEIEPDDVAADPNEAPPLAPGDILAGRYRIVRFIQSGGMGEVYEAEDQAGGGHVALKTIHRKRIGDPEIAARFRREVQMAKQVTHPNVCRIYDLHVHTRARAEGPHEELLLLTMELLEGQTLSERLEQDGPFSTEDALPLLEDMARALDAAHQRNVIHRDFKAQNVMLVKTNDAFPVKAVVMDFGLARTAGHNADDAALTRPGIIPGTPEYMSPEQLVGGIATAASDVYALGVVAFEMVTGKRPERAGGVLSETSQRLLRKYAPAWEASIGQSLAANPSDRFATPGEFARALQRANTRQRPHLRFLFRAVLIASVLLVAGIALLVANHARASRQYPTARPAVAVLGFKNLTGDPRLSNLSNAFTTGLAAELRAGEDVRVIPAEDVAHLKLDLKLPDVESYGAETLGHIRDITGADIVLAGSYVASPNGDQSSEITLYIVAQRTQSGDASVSLHEQGSEGDLPRLISKSVDDLRTRLNLRNISMEQRSIASSALPHNSEALRVYSEAVHTRNTYDLPRARKLFEEAIALEPSYAPAHAELAEVLSDLGHDKEARKEVELALSLSGSLPREEHLVIEGEYYDVHDDFAKAQEIYATLFRFFPDNLHYGLLLASVGTPPERLKTVEMLRQLPSPLRDDPRIDIYEAEGYSDLSNYEAAARFAARAAAKARNIGATGQVSLAENWQAYAEKNLGHPDSARKLYLECKEMDELLHDEISADADIRGLAVIKYEEGDLAGAAEDVLSVLKDAERVVSYVAQARDLSVLGDVRFAQGRLKEAESLYEGSLALWREQNSKINTGVGELDVARALHAMGRSEEARSHIMQCLSILQGFGTRFRANAFAELASIAMDEHNLGEAKKLMDQAFQNSKGVAEPVIMPKLLFVAGRLARLSGAMDEAAGDYERALQILESTSQKRLAAEARLGLAEVYLDRKAYSSGEGFARQALSEFEQEGRIIEIARARAIAALCIQGRGDSAEAGKMLVPAMKNLGQIEAPQVREYVREVARHLGVIFAPISPGRVPAGAFYAVLRRL